MRRETGQFQCSYAEYLDILIFRYFEVPFASRDRKKNLVVNLKYNRISVQKS